MRNPESRLAALPRFWKISAIQEATPKRSLPSCSIMTDFSQHDPRRPKSVREDGGAVHQASVWAKNKHCDQPVTRLDSGSRFVLRAMRVWVNAVQSRTCPPHALMIAIPQPELVPLIGDLHGMLVLLHRHGSGPMPFGEPKHPAITEGEALMLSLWALIAADEPERSRALIESLVTEAAAAPMQAAMVRAAACLSAVGLAPVGRMAAGSASRVTK
ncbi:hypothetical protein ACQ4M3_34160 [Leptolyngbya sp. AN03gr2]|uniref:hypothetical protein n=1 Tax=Leptolyngbya sp. AN03gr2 TaxID=3423364 RepID=UPI003D32280C